MVPFQPAYTKLRIIEYTIIPFQNKVRIGELTGPVQIENYSFESTAADPHHCDWHAWDGITIDMGMLYTLVHNYLRRKMASRFHLFRLEHFIAAFNAQWHAHGSPAPPRQQIVCHAFLRG